MDNYKLICYLMAILLTVFGLKNGFGQQLQPDDPSLFHFGSAQQMLQGTTNGTNYVEKTNGSRLVTVKFKDYLYVAWASGNQGSVNIACLGSTSQKEVANGDIGRKVYHGSEDTLGGFAYANYSPTMVVYHDVLYIYYNQRSDNKIHFLAISQEGTVTISSRGELLGASPTDLVNITAYPFPDADGILFIGSGVTDRHIRVFAVGTNDPFWPFHHHGYLENVFNLTLDEQCAGSVGFCKTRGGMLLLAWTGTDADHLLNSAFLDVNTYTGFSLNQKHTYHDHASHTDGPLLFQKDNTDDPDIHIMWRGKNDDNQIWQGVFPENNKDNFQQFSVATVVGTSNVTPALISLNEQITYMFWPNANDNSISYAKGLDYSYSDWMKILLKDEHTLSKTILPGSNNAGMNIAEQIRRLPNMYKLLDLPDFGTCNECGFVTQTTDFKGQLGMGYRYFGINLSSFSRDFDDIERWWHDPDEPLFSAVDPLDETTTICQGEGFAGILTNASDFLNAHPKEFIIINIKGFSPKTDTASIKYNLKKIIEKLGARLYAREQQEKLLTDIIEAPIGQFRGKIILTIANADIAKELNLLTDIFETTNDSENRSIDKANSNVDDLISRQQKFITEPRYRGSYKRVDWQLNLGRNKALCDMKPFVECAKTPAPGFWHHAIYLVECGKELVEMTETVLQGVVEPETATITLVGWILSAFSETSLVTMTNANRQLYPIMYELERRGGISKDNLVNIIYTDASDYLYTDLCMQFMIDFNEYEEVSVYNNQIAVSDSHSSVTCHEPKSGVATVVVNGGHAPYRYYWLSTGDTTATTTGLSEGHHKVRITDAMGHTVTRKVYVSIDPHSHAGLANRNLSKTEVQPYGLSNYYETDCDNLIARVKSNYSTTGVTDTLTASVWIDTRSTNSHVKRHYQLIPSRRADNASAEMTLYFTQKEFDEFNLTNPAFKLPSHGYDSLAIRNVMIWQKPGLTADGSGGLVSYPTTTRELFPKAANVVWNSTVKRWEITLYTEGFGAYFLTTHDGRERDEWLAAYITFSNDKPVVQWQVNEKEASRYYVEYSFDQINFVEAGLVNSRGRGVHQYEFPHQNWLGVQKNADSKKVIFYRVRQWFRDKPSEVSELLPVSLTEPGCLLVYPNPFSTELSIQSNIEATAAIYDLNGRVIHNLTLLRGRNSVSVAFLPPGFYIIRTASGESHKLVKIQ